ncbi:PTS sugar transporter subunit IIA [Brachybacterium huguangmaarense]|uniref:Mannitol-specific phosphotransferase enzyme IIA component n=1 Tax=Brachybacterium huguangmaarense TaxID=1652028 RepID=A0ABY6G2E0_9MICO|nr:PTS sugar transporter subunit IIA [Brachybacterium huguangmaarense]UYG17363.1 PTS sugar transporter subunit IIA [Brachybacterium huguangmaarense]
MSTTTETRSGFSPRVALQKVGTSLSNMVMPNIPALIAWGIFTAFFIPDGWTPSEPLATLVGPTIHYLLPLLIANTGGRMVYEARGAVVGVVATMGVIAGSDWLIAQENAPALAKWVAEGNDSSTFSGLGQVHMFIGAMIMAPLAAWLMKKFDQVVQPRIPAGFEMLVNMFSAGILAFVMAVLGFFGLAPVVNWVMHLLSDGVNALIQHDLLPLVSILIEPAKVFFLNNAINHGVLTPLGITEAAGPAGKSVLFLLEANPGPGLGILMAYTIFGRGAARASAPGAAIIQFIGGIHEIYFPYVLMKPILIIAAIGGGMTGVFLNVVFHNGLIAPASPGSILAIMGVAARGDRLTILIAVFGAAVVSFVLASLFLRIGKQEDGDIAAATAKMEQMKGKKSSVAGALTGAAGDTVADSDADAHTGPIHKIVFACDAGMGSSAMGATVLRKKIRSAGFSDVEVTNKAISSLADEWDLVVTQKELADRAAQRTGSAVHVAVDQFMNSPRYDEVVELVRERNTAGEAPAAAAPAAAPAAAATGTHRADTPADAPADAAGEVMPASSVVLHGTAASAASAIDEAGQLLVGAGAVDEAYVAAMHDRERSVSTFMGNGLAIPHGTNDAKSSIRRSGMSFIRYDDPIDWNGNEVRFVVGIAGQGNEHLALLQNVAMTFSDPAQVEKLEKATSADEILSIFDEE